MVLIVLIENRGKQFFGGGKRFIKSDLKNKVFTHTQIGLINKWLDTTIWLTDNPIVQISLLYCVGRVDNAYSICRINSTNLTYDFRLRI
ncbi:MAG: hypothetical protein DI548_08220 [Flavobacterium johnsoniae]|jgi:hypothetical protein|nr:MAG: hypothetical protein DI548_08220 [Flavobacterium johnsoniae]